MGKDGDGPILEPLRGIDDDDDGTAILVYFLQLTPCCYCGDCPKARADEGSEYGG